MSLCTHNRHSLTNDVTQLVCILNLCLPRFMLISPLEEIIFFILNQKVIHVLVATDKLSRQRITSQLLNGS
jgi:hypothetical protein